MSALIVVPQIVVAAFAPLVGRVADSWGRRPLLLLGLGVVPIRSTLFALTADPTLCVAIQTLDGLSGATLGVLTTLVIADLTKGTGRLNLAQALVATLSAVGASFSTSMSGLVVNRFGDIAECDLNWSGRCRDPLSVYAGDQAVRSCALNVPTQSAIRRSGRKCQLAATRVN